MEGGGKLFNCNYCNYCNRQHSLGIIFHTLTRPQLTLSAPNLEAINKQALTEDKFIPDTPETHKNPSKHRPKKPKYFNIPSTYHPDPHTPKCRFPHQKSALFPPFPQKNIFFRVKETVFTRTQGTILLCRLKKVPNPVSVVNVITLV